MVRVVVVAAVAFGVGYCSGAFDQIPPRVEVMVLPFLSVLAIMLVTR